MNEEMDEEDSEGKGLLLVVNEEGELDVYNPDDFVNVKKSDMEIIKGFIKENQEVFNKYIRKVKKK